MRVLRLPYEVLVMVPVWVVLLLADALHAVCVYIARAVFGVLLVVAILLHGVIGWMLPDSTWGCDALMSALCSLEEMGKEDADPGWRTKVWAEMRAWLEHLIPPVRHRIEKG